MKALIDFILALEMLSVEYLGPSEIRWVVVINPGIKLRAAAINSNVSVSPLRYYHIYGDIIIHMTTSHTFVRVHKHE